MEMKAGGYHISNIFCIFLCEKLSEYIANIVYS